MDEASKASQSAGGGQSRQRPVNHPKPFFYVQPPLQPFYTYQWHMNNPYNHSFPGSGFHFGRPCMMPYSYLQYPGYIMPHAAMHPVDYRRIYERNFPPAAPTAAYDLSFRQHQHGGAQRETTCAGAQTDPCEALNKLIECLDKLRTGEELHSRADSQTSGTLSPLAEAEEEECGTRAGKTLYSANLEPDTEASFSGAEHFAHQQDWSLSGEEPLLDNSSLQMEGIDVEEEEDYLHQDFCVQSRELSEDLDVPSGVHGTNWDGKLSGRQVSEPKELMEFDGDNISRPSSHLSQSHASTKTTELHCTESAQKPPTDVSGDYSCCILHLPFEKVLNTAVYEPGSTSQSLGSPFSYGFCPPKLTHERMSVLSPSLDELSSHDELLSTDLEDINLFPTSIYTRGKLDELASRKSHPPFGEIHADMRVLCPKRLTCAMCGSRAFKERSRSKAFHCETHCYGHVDDSDEEVVEAKIGGWEAVKTCRHCLGGTMSKMHSKKAHAFSKYRVRHREKFEGQAEESSTEHFCCDKCISSPEKSSGCSARGINTRLFKERRYRTQGVSDQIVWESAGINSRPKASRTPLPQRQVCPRKSRLKLQGSRNDSVTADDGDYDEEEGEEQGQEMLQFHRGKGDAKRGGARC